MSYVIKILEIIQMVGVYGEHYSNIGFEMKEAVKIFAGFRNEKVR